MHYHCCWGSCCWGSCCWGSCCWDSCCWDSCCWGIHNYSHSYCSPHRPGGYQDRRICPRPHPPLELGVSSSCHSCNLLLLLRRGQTDECWYRLPRLVSSYNRDTEYCQPLPHVSCLMSHVSCLMSHVSCLMSHVSCLTFYRRDCYFRHRE